MNKTFDLSEAQTKLLVDTIRKNEWVSKEQAFSLLTWADFHQSPEVLRNYLCKDASGYIRGYYDGAGIFYVKRFHLRDQEWTDPQSSPS